MIEKNGQETTIVAGDLSPFFMHMQNPGHLFNYVLGLDSKLKVSRKKPEIKVQPENLKSFHAATGG